MLVALVLYDETKEKYSSDIEIVDYIWSLKPVILVKKKMTI